MQTTPRIHINATKIYINDTLVTVLDANNVAYAVVVDNSVIDKMITCLAHGNTYVIEALTPMLTKISNVKPIIRAAKLIIEVNKDTSIA